MCNKYTIALLSSCRIYYLILPVFDMVPFLQMFSVYYPGLYVSV